MARRALPAFAVIVAVLMASGCGGDEGEVLRHGDSIVLVGAEGDGDNVAGIGYGGTVAMVGRCLGLNDATVIWPHGTKVVSDDPLTVDVPGLGRLRIGDEVGGGADVYGDHLPEGIDAIPSGCPTEEVVAFYPEGEERVAQRA